MEPRDTRHVLGPALVAKPRLKIEDNVCRDVSELAPANEWDEMKFQMLPILICGAAL
jgi:hypothetical protein